MVRTPEIRPRSLSGIAAACRAVLSPVSLRRVSTPESRSSTAATEPDLRMRIDARVAERRGDDRPPSANAVDAVDAVDERAAARRASVPRARHAAARGRGPAVLRARSGWRTVISLLCGVLLVILLRTFVVASYYIPSGSMEPTLHGCTGCEPDLVVVDKVGFRLGQVGRGDVVVINRPPLAPKEDDKLIKRVIGLPGDTVSAHGGTVYIGSQPLQEPYLNPTCGGTGAFAPVLVAAGHFFLLGDNRCDSFDSRRFGSISRSSIVGRAFAVIWPIKHLRWL